MTNNEAGQPRTGIRTALCNVYPNLKADFFLTQIRSPHMGLAYLSASAKEAGFHVDVWDGYNEAIPEDEMEEKLLKGAYDVIGFTTYEISIRGTFNLMKRLREAGYTGVIVVGGYQATFIYDEILNEHDQVDYVLTGECEESFVDLLKVLDTHSMKPALEDLSKVDGLVYRTQERNVLTKGSVLARDLNKLAFPDLDHLPNSEVQIMASRGCTAKCSFCAIKEFFNSGEGKAIRIRTVDNVIAEFKDRIDRFGTRNFVFIDDEFFVLETLRKGWVAEFVERVLSEKLDIKLSGIKLRSDSLLKYKDQVAMLQKLGLDAAFIGIETMDDEVLQGLFRKDTTADIHRLAISTLKEMGISPSVGMIPFHPYTTIDELEKNFLFYRDDINNFDYLWLFHRYNKLIIFPGTTHLSAKLQKENLLQDNGLGTYSWTYRDPNIGPIYDTFQKWDSYIRDVTVQIKGLVDASTKLRALYEVDAQAVEWLCERWGQINNELVYAVILRAKELAPSPITIADFDDILAHGLKQIKELNIDSITVKTRPATSSIVQAVEVNKMSAYI